MNKDKDFFLMLVRSCRETNLVKIAEIHLAADSNTDLMPYISYNIKLGHHEPGTLQVKGYYTLGDKESNGYIGKCSSFRKTTENTPFRIHTVYFAERPKDNH